MSVEDNNPVGVFVYRPGREPGSLDCDWAWTKHVSGKICKGRAKGGPETGFPGRYSIVYYDEAGKAGPPYDLEIEADGEAFRLVWNRNGQPIYRGMGLLLEDALVGGWGPIG